MGECIPKYEYLDDVLKTCISCENLCCRGEAALQACEKVCPSFVADCMKAKDSSSCQLNSKTCENGPSSGPTLLATTAVPSQVTNITILLSVIAVVLVIILVAGAIVCYKKSWTICWNKQGEATDAEGTGTEMSQLQDSSLPTSVPLDQGAEQAPPSLPIGDPSSVNLGQESADISVEVSDAQMRQESHPSPQQPEGDVTHRRHESGQSLERRERDSRPHRPEREATHQRPLNDQNVQNRSQHTMEKNDGADQTNPTLSHIVENRERTNNASRGAAVNNEDEEETPLMKPVASTQHDRAPHTDLRQQCRQLGRQVSEQQRNPTDPDTQRYQEETLQSLREDMVVPEHSHLLSIRDELISESLATKPLPTAPLDKFQVTQVLDLLEWVLQYMLDEEKFDVFVNFDDFTHLTYLVIIEILKKYTLRPEMDFRVKEMLPCLFTPLAGVVPGVTHAETLVPGAEIKIPRQPQQKTAACGLYLRCKQNGKFVYYAVTAGHAIREDDVCYFNGIPMGKCILKIVRKNPSRTMDIAVIEIYKDFTMDNTVFSAQGNKCGFRLPENMEEVCAMECWKIQRKSRESWQYGYLRYAVLTNKEHGFFRCIGVVRAHEACPVIREGDCGCLVTSLPREDRLTIYGMMLGRLTQTAEDGSEEDVEMYIAFPFKEALEELQQYHMFAGKELEIVPADDHSVTGRT